jgi:hypothetical protein
LSEYRFTDGNLIILYSIHRGKSTDGGKGIPDYINERIKACLNIYRIIMHSKPDRHKTMILIVAHRKYVEDVKDELVRAGVDEKIIAIDSVSKNVAQCFDKVVNIIKKRANPPYLYFIGSVWLKDIYDYVVVSKLKGYRVQFEGALDHRPINEVEKEKALDVPKKGIEYYKRKAKDKTIDMVLNYIFPDNNKLP